MLEERPRWSTSCLNRESQAQLTLSENQRMEIPLSNEAAGLRSAYSTTCFALKVVQRYVIQSYMIAVHVYITIHALATFSFHSGGLGFNTFITNKQMVNRLAVAVAIMGAHETSAAHRDLISSKSRFLIQSVVQKRGDNGVTFGKFKAEEVAAGTFCEPAMQLENTEGKETLEVFKQQSAAATKAYPEQVAALTQLGTNFRLDDLRRAEHMKNIWKETIFKELEKVDEAVGVALKHFTDDQNAVGELKGNKEYSLPAASEESISAQRVLPVPAGKTEFAETAQEHMVGEKAKMAKKEAKSENDNVVIKAHRLETWADMFTKFENAQKSLEALQKSVKREDYNFEQMFEDHIAAVKAGVGYALNVIPKADTRPSTEAAITALDLADYQPAGFSKDRTAALSQALTSIIAKAIADPTAAPSPFENFIQAVVSGMDQGGAIKNKDGTREVLSGDAVEQMDRLTTSLSFLHMYRMGIHDGRRSLLHLLGQVQGQIAKVQGAIGKKIAKISGGLTELLDEAKIVYKEAEALHGVKIVRELEMPNGDESYLNKFGKMVNGKTPSAFNELPELFNMVVNVIWRLHAHLIGFVHVATEQAGKVVAEKPEPERDEKYTGNKLRYPADCLLYGSIDVLLLRIQRTDTASTRAVETDVCEAVHKAGMEALGAAAPKEENK
jgi:hypothetical protein